MTQKPDAVEFCPDCRHPMNCHHDGRGIWGKGCNQPLAMELQCPCQNTPQTFTAIERLTAERDDLKAEVEAGKRLFAEMTVIEGKGWSISNNGNPSALIALRQFDGDGDLVSYTHHETALEAFAALEGESR